MHTRRFNPLARCEAAKLSERENFDVLQFNVTSDKKK